MSEEASTSTPSSGITKMAGNEESKGCARSLTSADVARAPGDGGHAPLQRSAGRFSTETRLAVPGLCGW